MWMEVEKFLAAPVAKGKSFHTDGLGKKYLLLYPVKFHNELANLLSPYIYNWILNRYIYTIYIFN